MERLFVGEKHEARRTTQPTHTHHENMSGKHVEPSYAGLQREGKGRHRHLERNEQKLPPKAHEEDIPTQDETIPDPGKERVLKGHTLPVNVSASRRIQSAADRHPTGRHPGQDLKSAAMSSAEHIPHTHA